MKELREKMIEQLSEQDKIIFAQLAEKLNKVGGDLGQLSEQERAVVSKMQLKYTSKLSQFPSNDSPRTFDLLESGFASYARQILAKDLNTRFPKEEDAVEFAYQNKWLPESFKDRVFAEKIFENHRNDICQANQWREDLVGVESDKLMTVGMTWFMVVYQLYQKRT